MNNVAAFCYQYPRPAVTTDMVAFRWNGELNFLLIKRKNPPYENQWAFPGGFLNMGETLAECVKREFFEETHLRPTLFFEFGSFSAVKRDPRGRVISIAFWTILEKEHSTPHADDDAKESAWFTLQNIPPLAFDHDEMLRKAITDLRNRLLFHPSDFQIPPLQFVKAIENDLIAQCKAFLEP